MEGKDEIQHYGNRNSGRYRRGSGRNPKSTLAKVGRIIDNHVQYKLTQQEALKAGTKQARSILKIREQNDKIIRNGLKRLSSMTPEESAVFLEKMKRFNAADSISEERIAAIANTKISVAKTYTAKMDAADASLKVAKTAVTIAKSLSKLPLFSDLSDSLTHVSKAVGEKAKKGREGISKVEKAVSGPTKTDALHEIAKYSPKNFLKTTRR